MVLGNIIMPKGWRPTVDPSSIDPQNMSPEKLTNFAIDEKIQFSYGTLLEYNKDKLVWWWRSGEYYKQVDFHDCADGKPVYDIHENAFFFDEVNKAVYVSFKNISQIVKVNYPSGVISNIFGSIYYPGQPCSDTTLFFEQHACKITHDGHLIVFNNNVNHIDEPPTVVEMEEPKGSKMYLKKVWEYIYPVKNAEAKVKELTSGGNVQELSDHSLFVSMCSPFGNTYIVDKQKHLIWDAEMESYCVPLKKWISLSQYRNSFISSRKEMESLIWNSSVFKN